MVALERIGSYKKRLIAIKPRGLKKCDREALELFNAVFEDIFEILNSGTAVSDQERLLLSDTLGVWFLRTRQLVEIGKLVDTPNEDQQWFTHRLETELLSESNCDFFFRYVIDFWNEGGAALTNSLNDLLSKLIQLSKVVRGAKDWSILLNSWVSQTMEIPATMRVSYFLLHILASETDLSQVLERRPDFVEHSLSLMWTESLATPIGKCIASLLVNLYEHYHKDNSDLSLWFLLWEKPTMHYFQDTRMRKRIEVCVLIPIFKTLGDRVFEEFVSRNFPCEVPELIPFLKIGQELLIEEAPFENDRLVSLKFLEQMIQQDDYKLSVFELLTSSPKRSKTVAPYIYDMIKRNVHEFFVDIEVKSRNEFHSLFKHFTDRIRDSVYSLDRDIKKLRVKNKFPEEQAQKSELIAEAFRFMTWLIEFLKLQLAPGSQYQRQILSTKLLKTLVSSSLDKSILKQYLDPRLRMEFPFEIRISQNGTLRRVLLDNLCDNYNDIRDNCLELLIIFSRSTSDEEYLSASQYDVLLNKSMALLGSYKGCEGGAKMVEYLFEATKDKQGIIDTLLQELGVRVDSASSDLMKKIDLPVNGYFLALSLILRSGSCDSNAKEYSQNLDRCIDLILRNWENVEFILCDDPFENSDDDVQAECKFSDPQVISYAFRSIKDSAELLNTLMTVKSLSKDQILACGELMLTQLSTIRHSGAFQSLIPSFNACCQRCYKEQPLDLRRWLDAMLDALETKTQFITRRSGGIPHIICSIVSSENSGTRSMLELTFERLMRIASVPVSEHEETVDLPQVNAFNCIKALFVESPLSNACAPYVYQSLVLCIQSFTSPLWSLRNCSFMLFSALQNRLFGKAGKNISARLFFARFEGVREILRLQFESSVSRSIGSDHDLDNKETSLASVDSQVESIFLVLTLLSRLKQTPGFNGLDDFTALVISCLKSQNWSVRQLAARTLPTLVTSISAQILMLVEKLLTSRSTQNETHGIILALSALLAEGHQNLSTQENQELSRKIMRGVPKFVTKNPCFVTAKAFVQLVATVFSKCSVPVSERRITTATLGNYFIQLNDEYSIDGTKQLLVRSLLLLLLENETQENFPELVALALESPFFEAQIAAANFLSQHPSHACLRNSIIEEVLLEKLLDNSVWDLIKLSVLKALIRLEVPVDYALLMDVMKNSSNDELRAVALEYAGFSVAGVTSDYARYVSDYSQDESHAELRRSALNSLVHATKREYSIQLLFLVQRFLYDDDLELRNSASEHINSVVLQRGPNKRRTNFSSTARLFVQKMQTLPEARLIAFERLKSSLLPLTFCSNAIDGNDDLFEVEPANQFRNVLEEGLRDVEILESCVGIEDKVQSLVSSAVEEVVSQIEKSGGSDGPMGWGSNTRFFAQLVCLRKLALNLLAPERVILDRTLRKYECHPLVFELTDSRTIY
ncbi:LAME_0E02234g1_1 [Lachancea meyersii CBS 8951]|uniref:LAME_0E02234g1_1 n=1 Tax=Lachancea meyersii CBS 8951 TaxID=1266667 RepID=A0A1G4JFV7_9SACH|nr:LAME_0E02234g1_1 [Lachancea meyersii CBS 8951]